MNSHLTRVAALVAVLIVISQAVAFAFNSGDRVQCTADAVKVRSSATFPNNDSNNNTNLIGYEYTGNQGTVQYGPYSGTNNTKTWYYIKWDNLSQSGYTVLDYLQIVPSVPPVTLTLYIRNGSASGPVISGAQVTGYDAVGAYFSQTTGSGGYVTITGKPGAWSFTASASGYNANSWSQSITSSTTLNAFVTPTAISTVATPVINPGSMSTTSPVSVTMSCSTSGATIRYTTNGIDPTSTSTVYGGAFTVSSSATVNARAFKSGMGDSAVASASYIISALSGPANNNFANRAGIGSSGGTVTGSNVNATKETGEPNHAGIAGGKSVWWTWTPSASGTATISTAGSSFDTLLAVYTGSSVSGLSLVIGGSNDDYSGTTSQVTISVTAGIAYQIAVDGFNAASGNIALTTTPSYAPDPTNINDLATVIMSEASGCNNIEQEMVGWTLINRMANDHTTSVRAEWGAYAHNQPPTQAIINLAASLLNGTISDLSQGATHFYSPISMPMEGESTTNYDVGGGLEQTPGLPNRNYCPGWSKTLTRVYVTGVREIYFKFYK